MSNGKWLMLCLLLMASCLQAQKAHVHGKGQLQVSAEGKQLNILLTLPAMDVVGFEHAPSSSAQQAAVSEAAERLGNVTGILMPSADADCVVQSIKVSSELLSIEEKEHHHYHSHDHDHADFFVEYQFSCGKPELLRQLDLKLFGWLAQLQLDAQALTEHGAQIVTLGQRSPTLLLRSTR